MNIIIENGDFDVSSINFESEEGVKIEFNKAMDASTIVGMLAQLCEAEEQYYSDNNKLANVVYNLKGLSVDTLVEVMKFALSRETLINSSIILNINLLINGYNTLDDSLFESEAVYVEDLEQLLDLKLDLVEEIKVFYNTLTMWYLSCLKSAFKVEYTYLDTAVKVPMLYKRILSSSNVLTLSQIMSKSTGINVDDLVLVENAYPIVAEIVSCSSLANELLQLITNATEQAE